MAFTLQNLLTKAYLRLGQLTVSSATTGSTSAVVDDKQAGQHGDNEWKNGVVFLIRDAGGASATPEGEMSLVTGYTDSSGSFATVWTTGVTASDIFGFANDFYPLYTMIELANEAVQSFGPIVLIDTSTTSAANQTEYTYPIACKRRPPIRVDYQGITTDANDNQWIEIPAGDYRYEPATAGSTGKIVIPQLPSGRTIRIWYEAVHPTLSAATSTIHEGFEPELVTQRLVELALEWQNGRMQGGDSYLLQRESKAGQNRLEAEIKFQPSKPRRQPKLLILRGHADEDEFTTPDPA
jgi:hypothetical protein